MFQTILDAIQAADTIIIHRHLRPDPDAIGSQLGLKAVIESNFPAKKVLAVGQDEPSLTWLGEMDKVDAKAYKEALVIVTDTANRPRIDDERYTLGETLIKIDHHPNDDAYGHISHVDTTASSTSEIITDWAKTQNLQISPQAARLLYAGIIGDTGRFLYPSTSQKTLALAAFLRQVDFDFVAVTRQMDTLPYKIAKLQAYLIDQLSIHASGAARVTLTRAILEQYGVSDSESSLLVSFPGKIEQVKAWAIFVEQATGQYRVRLRSKTVPINTIAKNHEGGGHPLASGANSYSLAENEEIFEALKQVLKEAAK